jgi:glycosyltransferase involved in cell wall biosynthesis
MSRRARPAFLVIPCFHESRRLPPFLDELCRELSPHADHIRILAVDDGSGTAETEALAAAVDARRAQFPQLLLPLLKAPHEGKGGAILHGWHEAPPDTAHYAFVDADGAVPAPEVRRVLLLATTASDADSLWFATRQNTASTVVQRDPGRRITGKIYAILANLLLGSRVRDPACGFKIIPRSFYERFSPLLRETGWALDLELLARARTHGYSIRQEPVSWSEKSGTRLGRGDALRIFMALLRIRREARNW